MSSAETIRAITQQVEQSATEQAKGGRQITTAMESISGLVADLDAHRIAYAWLLTWNLGPAEQSPEHANYLNPALTLPDGSHPGIPLSELLATRVQYPQRFVVAYCPHPAWPNAPALLEAAHHMHDVRICGEWKFRLHFDDPRCLALFRMAGKLKLPVVLHLDVPWLPDPKTGERRFEPLASASV